MLRRSLGDEEDDVDLNDDAEDAMEMNDNEENDMDMNGDVLGVRF